MRTTLALLFCTAAVAAAGDDPIAVLTRLRDQVLEQNLRMPNHTCLESVERERYQRIAELASRSCDDILARRAQANFSHLLRLSTTDRLHLDVAYTGNREIFSWAGADRFADGDVDDVVYHGAIGTGVFATLLVSAFEDRIPRFTFDGETSARGRSAFQYSFHVPFEESHYRFKYSGASVIVGYTGTLLVDEETSALLRLKIRTEELPAETANCEVDTALDYGTVRLNNGDFLLPTAAHQKTIARDGSESDNRYSFSACRDFKAESTIDFDKAHVSTAPAQADHATPSSDWPTGLRVIVEVAAPVDLATAAAGDAIQGRLAEELRNARDGALIPAGTPVAGRLLRVETRHVSPVRLTVALRWESLTLNGRSVPLPLAPDYSAKFGWPAADSAGISNLVRRGGEFELPLPGEVRSWILTYSGDHHIIETGTRTQWLTTKP